MGFSLILVGPGSWKRDASNASHVTLTQPFLTFDLSSDGGLTPLTPTDPGSGQWVRPDPNITDHLCEGIL